MDLLLQSHYRLLKLRCLGLIGASGMLGLLPGFLFSATGLFLLTKSP